MPTIICPSCSGLIHFDEGDYEGELTCPECGALLHVTISGGVIQAVVPLGEGFEGDEWEGDLETWTEKEQEG